MAQAGSLRTSWPQTLDLIPSTARLLQAGEAEPEDLVIISISSHGVEHQGVFYLPVTQIH